MLRSWNRQLSNNDASYNLEMVEAWYLSTYYYAVIKDDIANLTRGRHSHSKVSLGRFQLPQIWDVTY